MCRTAALALLCFVVTSSRTSIAQATSIPGGTRIRVTFPRENPRDSRQPPVQGSLLAADDTSLVLMPRGSGATPRLIRIRPSVRLEIYAGQRGSNARSGALKGLIGGAIVGFAVGAAADTECECRLALGGATGLVFGLGGGLIGAGIGATTNRELWRQVTLPVRVEPPTPR